MYYLLLFISFHYLFQIIPLFILSICYKNAVFDVGEENIGRIVFYIMTVQYIVK